MPESPVMDADEAIAFLASKRTGVLALASADQPYAIPVSYAFDQSTEEVLLRLGHLDDTQKDEFLDGSTAARMVVHDTNEPKSVIVDGRLVELDKTDLDPETIRSLGEGETPAFDIWPVEKPDLDVTIHRLTDATVTGRSTGE